MLATQHTKFDPALPLLIAFGTKDKLTSFDAGKELFDKVNIQDKTFRVWDGLYHERMSMRKDNVPLVSRAQSTTNPRRNRWWRNTSSGSSTMYKRNNNPAYSHLSPPPFTPRSSKKTSSRSPLLHPSPLPAYACGNLCAQGVNLFSIVTITYLHSA